ncbi:MAG TPA: bile acid:sodium symporter [Myxococcaceae bacterium]|nr:bile acid:sodium symporter [Myxococcaceae bacterium]
MPSGTYPSAMDAVLSWLIAFSVPAFAATSMASVGVGAEPHRIVRPFRRPVMLLTALLANFVVVPLLAWFLSRSFKLPEGDGVGLLLLASAAGSPFTLSLVRAARGSISKAGALLVLLLPATILYLPLVIPRVFPGAHVDAGPVARNLVLSMLLPLMLGAWLRWFRPVWALRLFPLLNRIAPVLLLILIASTFLANLTGIGDIVTEPSTLAAAALMISGGVLAGYALGVPTRRSRVVLSLGTGQRNVAAATIVAASLPTQGPLTMVVASSIIGFVILFPAAWLLRGRGERLRRRRGAASARIGTRDPIPHG